MPIKFLKVLTIKAVSSDVKKLVGWIVNIGKCLYVFFCMQSMVVKLTASASTKCDGMHILVLKCMQSRVRHYTRNKHMHVTRVAHAGSFTLWLICTVVTIKRHYKTATACVFPTQWNVLTSKSIRSEVC